MPFQKGMTKTGGRQAGTPNRRSPNALEILAEQGFCPLTVLMDGCKIALENFTDQLQKLETGRISPMESEASKYLRIALDCAAKLADYAHPRLKSVEVIKPNQFDGMTLREKLEAMKGMVALLEIEVAKQPKPLDGPGSS